MLSHALSMLYLCSIYAPSMPYPYPVHALSMPYPCPIHAPSMPRPCLGYKAIQKNATWFLKSLGLTITHYLGVSLTGRAFRSNLFWDKKGFPLQSLTRSAFEAYAKRQNGSH